MIIKTKDFILRPEKLSDAEKIFEYLQDAESRRNLMGTPKSVAQVKREFLKRGKDSEYFVIEINGDASGSIGIDNIVKGHKAIISYWLAKKYRGRGITTKAVKIATSYFFKKYKLVRISGSVRTFNIPSAKVLQKAGYKLEGILHKNKLKDGKYLDDMLWAKVR